MGRELLAAGAWGKILARVPDLEVLGMKVMVHARAEVPPEKMTERRVEVCFWEIGPC